MKQSKNQEQQTVQSIITKSPKVIPLKYGIIYISVALIVGFIGGIRFADHADKKLFGQSAHQHNHPVMMDPNMMGNMPGPANMDLAQAIIRMEELLVNDPENESLLIHLGNLYFETGQPMKSINAYERALKINPDNPDVLTDCGIMYREIKDYQKALDYFSKAGRLNPNHFQSMFNIGVIYREDLKEYQKAIDAWTALLNRNPNSPHAGMIRTEIEKTKSMMK